MRNETAQYFFHTPKSKTNLKKRISFTYTYPPSLSIFLEIIKKIFLLTLTKTSFFNTHSLSLYPKNRQSNNTNSEFRTRIETLEKEFPFLDILETRIRLCTEDTHNEYFPKMYDPLLNGPDRVRIKKKPLLKTSKENLREAIGLNQIHGILFTYPNSDKIEPKGYAVQYNNNKLLLEIDNLLLLTGEFDTEPNHNLNFNPFLLPDQEEVKIDFEKEREFFKNFSKTVRNHPNLTKIRKEYSGRKEISKRIPRRSYKLRTEFQQRSIDRQVRLRKAKRVVIFTAIKKKTATNKNKDTNIKDPRKVVVLRQYSQKSDFNRRLIKGSIRAQRRKISMWELFQANAHSPLFLDRIKKYPWFSFDRSGLIKVIFPNWIHNRIDFKILENTYEETKKEHKKEKDKKEENKRKEQTRVDIAEAWDSTSLGQLIRGFMLITQSNFRKYILLPSLIIAKNIGRMVLLQVPEWFEDLQEWNRELHIKCTYNGIQLSETEFPRNWLRDGIQIKILFPFCLKPWHRSKLRPSHRNLMQNKKERNDFCFLTVWGMETDLPFGSPRKRSSFFKPIFKELETKIGKSKNTYFLARKTLRGKTKLVSKQIKNWVIQNSFLEKKKIRVFSKLNPIQFFSVSKVYKSNPTKKNKDSTSINEIIPESFNSKIQPPNRTMTEKKTKDLTARAITIRNQIERMTKDKKKNTGIFISANKRSYKGKRLESSKNILEIIKRRNLRLISKIYFFRKFFFERIYTNPFLSILNLSKLIKQLFLDSINKFITKLININEADEEGVNKKNENPIHFISIISTIQKSINTIRNQTNSQKCCYLSYLSQAYVFYNLSQTQGIHFDQKYVFKYHDYGIPFFVKTEIKNSFEGVIDSELSHKKRLNYEINRWKNWLKKLKRHYQYNLSEIRGSILLPKRRGNRIYQHPMTQNCKRGSYEKDGLISFKKQNTLEVYFLRNQKDNFQKYSRYDLLSYQSSNSENENKRDSSIYGSTFETQVNRKQDSYYNSNTHKYNFFDIWGSSPITNYIGKSYRKSMEKNPDRKYFDWKTLDFGLSQKIAIGYWIKTDTKSNQNTKMKTKNYQITDKIAKKNLLYLTLPKKPKIKLPNLPKTFLDWTGMNEEILNPISTLDLWLFPESLILYNLYKMKPWVISSKVLLLRRNLNQHVRRENKNIVDNKEVECVIPSNKKNLNQKEFLTNKGDLRSDAQKRVNLESHSSIKHQKDIEKHFGGSKVKGGKKKKQYKSKTEAELDLLLKRYSLFQLRWGDTLNQKMINNIKIYCLLLRLVNPRKITISSIQRREMTLDILLIQKNFSFVELIKRGLLVIEPARLSVKNDGQFILYQTLCISLVHKSKQKNDQGYPEQADIDKNAFDFLVPETILPHKYRREFRIKICFNSKNTNTNPVFYKASSCSQFLNKHKHLDKEKNELIKVKFFTWPNYRLEDLACMNRYWFDTNNGSRFSMLRIYMYPRLKRCW
uniref:Protein TIC 214 n=1 Tax=Swertia nervosa TaxID=363513 RepID=A0A895KTU6_9GENT|nr:photosystem I assembly protein Ycf1 [Swertia nervosa]QRZ59503.1 photosystem I assembly protein Ycf1 [Swertia nervosa]